MSRTLFSLVILVLAAAALVPIASSAAPVRAEPGLPSFCWVLDSAHAGQISPGGEAFLGDACRTASASEPPTSVGGDTTQTTANTTPSGAVFFGNDVLVNDPGADTPPHTTQSETTIVECGGTTLAAWNDSGSADSGTFTGYARSLDEGRTWTDLGNIPGPTGSDPVLAVDSECRFYFSAIGHIDDCGAIGVVSSDDGGTSWSPVVNASPGLTCSAFQDKEWMAVDTSGGPDDGNVYLCWDERGSGGVTVYFSRSTDRGASFSDPVELSSFGSGFATGCQVQADRHGRVYAVWTNGNDLTVRLRVSDDGGESFEPHTVIVDSALVGQFGTCGAGSQRPLLNGDIRAFNWPGFAIHPVTGSLHVVWNDGSIDGADILYSRSFDGGETWSERARINDDATETDQFQPAIAFNEDGVLRAMWLDRRLDPVDNDRIDVFSVASFDEGDTFAPNERISDVSFGVPPINPNFDPEVVSCYMGDYNGITGVGGWHYMVWGDSRNLVDGRPDPDVFFDKRNIAVVRLTVTRTDDPSPGICLPSDCSLREAIFTAEQTVGSAEIRVPAGNYALTIPGEGENAGLTGDLDVFGDVIIRGDGANATIINAQGIDRVFDVHRPGSVTIGGLSIRGGLTTDVPGGPDPNGGGVRNESSLVLDAVSISGNAVERAGSGGGVYNSGLLLLRNSIIFSNASAFDGGGVYNSGAMTVSNSTITGNSVAFTGGGVANSGETLLDSVTISRNEGGSAEGEPKGVNVNNDLSGLLSVHNSIVAGGGEASCGGEIRSLGYNIEDRNSCGFDAPGDLPNTDPFLASRGINGGPTLTISIFSGSPALDAGDPAVCPLFDQRGFIRPVDGDGDGGPACDIGAFEFGSLPLGDVDCSLTTDVVDALGILMAAGDLALPDCLDLAGDTNCDGAKDTGDALTVLRHLAALPLSRPADCPPFGFG